MRVRAGELGADPGQVSLVGYSAGAHISLLAAATAGSESESESTDATSGMRRNVAGGGDREFGGESESVAAIAAFFAPVTSDGSVALTLGRPGHRGCWG